ncbi:MAG: hypothetical protein IJU54_02775 [Alphaproteobacteria bacterium]|nr:hypothetical protein [Alphaproteobacteria bacterium]
MQYTKLVLLIMVLDLSIDCGSAMHAFQDKSDSVISSCNIKSIFNINKSYSNLFSNNNLDAQNIYTECNNSTAENTEDYQKNDLHYNKAGVKKLNNNGQKIKKPIENNVNCRDSGINIGIRNSISKHDSDTQLDNNEAFSYDNSAMKLVTMPPVRNEIDDMSRNTTLITLNTSDVSSNPSENDDSILLIQTEKNSRKSKRNNNHNINTILQKNIFQRLINSHSLPKMKYVPLNKKNVNSKWNQHYNKESIKSEVKNSFNVELVPYINNDIEESNNKVTELVPYINNDTEGNNNITTESAQYSNYNMNANKEKGNSRKIKLPAYVNNNSKNYKTSMFNQQTNAIIEKLCQKEFKKLPDKFVASQNKQEIKQIVNKIKDNKHYELAQKSLKKLVNKAVENQNKQEIKQIINAIKDKKQEELAQNKFKRYVDNFAYPRLKNMFDAVKDHKANELSKKSIREIQRIFENQQLNIGFCANVISKKINNIQKKAVRPSRSITELGEYYRKLVPLDNFKDIEEFVNDFIKNCHLVYRYKTCWYNKKYKEFCKYIDANNSFKLDIKTIRKLSETLKKLLGLCSDDDAEMFESDFNEQKNTDINNYYTECIQSQIDHYENTDTPYNIGTKTEISNMKDYFIQLQVNQQNMIDKQQIIELFKNKIDFTSTRYVVHEDENGKKESVLTTDNSIESHILHLIAICKHWKEVYDKYHNLYDFLQKVEQQSLSKKNNIVLN